MEWNVIPFKRKKRLDWLQGITPRKRSRRFPVTAAAGFVVGVSMALAAIFLPPPHLPGLTSVLAPPPQRSETEQFSLCFTGGGYNCVVDGDTFHYHFTKIRIADIDTPETHPPRCAHEAELGRRATLRLQELLNQGPFTLEAVDRDHDQYGRELKIVMRGGASLGARLVDEGLARRWTGHREPWC